jgi:hypothetical protein
MSIFNENTQKRRNNNQFDMAYGNKFTGQFGKLIPFYYEETLPGDNFDIRAELKTELAPLLSDLNHMIDIHMDYFYVPYDSIWSNWRDFISGGENYDQNPTLPFVAWNDANKQHFKTGTLADYLGIPCWDKNGTTPTITGQRNINALFFRAYQHIYNEWYRDQDLIAKVDIQKDTDGLCSTDILELRSASWNNDLFTSCRPEAQKGDPVNFLAREKVNDPNLITWDGSNVATGTANIFTAGATSDPSDGIIRDSSNTEMDLYATVQQLRKGEALQKFYEAMQRGGNRYNEYLNTMWGVTDQDRRLQIPELIQSSQHPLQVAEVVTTTNQDNTTTDDNVAGQAYGRATAYGQTGANFKAPDYGCIIGIVKYVPRPSYMFSLPEVYDRTNRFEWYTDHLAEIGEEIVKKSEIYTSPTNPNSTTGNQDFGYHHRYYAFKCRHDQISGDFKYGLNFRHMSRDVTTYPLLNQDFIEIGGLYDTFSLTRIFNVIDSDLDYIWSQVFNDVTISRDVKYISTPQ